MTRRKFLVTSTPPTTNGDLHVGHLSGPYLAADVFCRAQRLLGHAAVHVSGGDDHQTYVVTTAERLGGDPHALARECTAQIRETLAQADVAIDAFTSPGPAYVREVQAFFHALSRAGKLEVRTRRFPFSTAKGRYLYEAYVQGACPECYGPTCGAICEECGHPNDIDTLLLPRSSAGDTSVEMREVKTLVLPLEAYRGQLEALHAGLGVRARPHVQRFVAEMLSAPLPDFPVSYPGAWGVPVGLAGFEGQVVNVWAEMLPGLVHMGAAGLAAAGLAQDGSGWQQGSGYELVQFFGYDNTFYFSFVHPALAFAHGGLVAPTALVTNEFYQLEGSKFSTSRRHLIWARDLVARHGPDLARFYLALCGPEHQQANFTEPEMVKVCQARLCQPLRDVADALRPLAGAACPVSAEDHAFYARYVLRTKRAYTPERFSLRHVAETTANVLGVVRDLARGCATSPATAGRAALGLRYVAACTAPLMPRLAQQLWGQLGASGEPSLGAVEALRELRVPALLPLQLLPAGGDARAA